MTRSDRLFGLHKPAFKSATFSWLHCLGPKARSSPVRLSDAEDQVTGSFSFPLSLPKASKVERQELGISSDDEVEGDMGKSNKFDFTNRPSSGTKLGNSIASTLTKEADRIAVKSRKQSTSSSAGSEKDASGHPIDLQAPNKDLGDDGVCALADGLEIALRSGSVLACLALEDLNLSGNGITTVALARLAPIIDVARHDLKTLNLANNKIRVTTDEEAEQWEAFLLAFKDCFRLRRLDLSNNKELGVRGLEMFARVHINEPAITPTAAAGDVSVLSLVSENGDDDGSSPVHDSVYGDEDETEMGKSLSDVRLLKRRCGLRSIPYITLHDIGLTDAGALWFSYVLEDHHYPNQLTHDLNGTHATSHIKIYQQSASSGGIDWDENMALMGRDGLALLHKTETLRRQTMLDDQSTLAGSVLMEDGMAGDDTEMQARRMSTERRFSRSLPGARRASIRSIHTIDGGEHEASELESARRRIQRHVIEHDKVSSVELWHAALKLVKCSRLLLLASPSSRQLYTGEPMFHFPAAPPEKQPLHQAPAPAKAQAIGHANKLSIDTGRATPGSRGSYAATLTAMSSGVPGEPELAITEATNSPTTPKMVFKPHRKGAFSEGSDLPTVTEKLNGLIVRDDNPERFVRYQQDRIVSAGSSGTAYRDSRIASHLTQGLVERIFGFVERGKWEVLSEAQRKAAFAWGQDRASLKVELEWRRKDEASQVWMMLDSINCLGYDQ